MELAVSAVNSEAVSAQNHRAGQTEKAGESFQTAFKEASKTESMDAVFAEAAARYGVSEKL